MNERTFFEAVGQRLHCDRSRAEGVTLAVFRKLRDRLTPNEGADVAAQLPRALKRMWQEHECADRTVERMHKAEFIGQVRHWAGLPDDVEAERAVCAVFAELQRLLGSPSGMEGEAWDIYSQLPKDLKRLWATARDGAGRQPG